MTEETDKKTGPQIEEPEAQVAKELASNAPAAKLVASPEDIAQKAAYVEAQRLAQLKKEIEEVEKRVEKKLSDFKKFVDDTATHGETMHSERLAETPDQKQKREINEFLKDTGFQID